MHGERASDFCIWRVQTNRNRGSGILRSAGESQDEYGDIQICIKIMPTT